jgi:phage-related protein
MQVGELWVKISGRDEAFNATMSKVQGTIRTAASRAEESSKALLKVVGAAATAAAAAVGVIGVKAIESAANAQAMNAQFEQVFGAVQANAQATVNALGEDFGMLPNRIKPALTSMTSMFKGLGYDTEEAMNMAKDAVTLAADAAAFYDKSYEDANAALNSFIKGNYEGGEAIGLFGNETQIAAFAAEKLGISWKDAGEAQKQLARLEYAKAMQDAAGATGQAAREADSFQNQLGNLKQGWIDFLAIVGQPLLEPAVNALKGMTEQLQAFKDLVTTEGLAGAIEKIFPDWLEATIFAIAGAITVAMIPALTAMATAAWAAVAPLLPFLAAGAAIGALAYLIIKNWEPIKDFFINLWDGITSTATACWEALKAGIKVFTDMVTETWEGFKNKTTEIWEAIKQFLVDWWPYLLGALLGPIGLVVAAIYDNWDAIKQSTIEIWTTIQTWLYELWEKIKSQVTKAWESVYDALTNVWDMIKTGFNDLVDSAKNWGRNLIQNLIDGIKDRFEALRDIVSDMASTVSGYLGFSSPTKLGPGRYADKWAPNLVNMFAEGIKNSMPALQVSLADMAAVMPAALGPSITNNSASNNYGHNTFHITVGGGSTREQAEGIMRELHRLGVRF